MSIAISGPTHLPTPLSPVANANGAGANAQTLITLPEAPKALMQGRWEEFRSAIETHRGARNAALVGHVLNVVARTAALGVAIASIKEDWQSYVDIPLHTLAAATQIANLLLAVSKFHNGPEETITGAEIRDTNVFQSVGEWTSIDALRNYGKYVSMIVTNGPLVFGAVHNGITPLLETLGIPVPSWLRNVEGAEHVGTAIADGVATAGIYTHRYVIDDVIAGSERRALSDKVVGLQTQKDFAVLEDDCQYVHIEPIPETQYAMAAGKIVRKVSAHEAVQPTSAHETADVDSIVSTEDDEFFDARSENPSLDATSVGEVFHDALDAVSITIEPAPNRRFDAQSLISSGSEVDFQNASDAVSVTIEPDRETRL